MTDLWVEMPDHMYISVDIDGFGPVEGTGHEAVAASAGARKGRIAPSSRRFPRR